MSKCPHAGWGGPLGPDLTAPGERECEAAQGQALCPSWPDAGQLQRALPQHKRLLRASQRRARAPCGCGRGLPSVPLHPACRQLSLSCARVSGSSSIPQPHHQMPSRGVGSKQCGHRVVLWRDAGVRDFPLGQCAGLCLLKKPSSRTAQKSEGVSDDGTKTWS